MRNRSRNLVLALVVLAACGPAASQEPALGPSGPDGVLWLDTDAGMTALDVADGTVRLEVRNAVATQDFTEIYSSQYRDEKTTLVGLRPDSAQRRSRMVVGRSLVANVAGAGGLVALTQPRSPGATPWLPDGRENTTLVVADPAAGTKRTYPLRGNFEPEAFSTDGRRLYVIEYVPPSAPSRYRVRILNLANGKISAIGRLKLKAPDEMRGTGRTQVFAPEGHELYTLYTRQGPNYEHGGAADPSRDRTHAFVHVLNLEGGWAHCIDLPMPFGTGRATASSIAISPDGTELYVSDWTNGAVAVIDPSEVRVLRTAQLPLGDADDRTFAAASSAGFLYVAGDDQVATIDTESMKVVDRWQMQSEVTGLEVGRDGRVVYVAFGDSIAMIDADGGGQIRVLSVGSVNDILHAS